jgi:hypothetical protein
MLAVHFEGEKVSGLDPGFDPQNFFPAEQGTIEQ